MNEIFAFDSDSVRVSAFDLFAQELLAPNFLAVSLKSMNNESRVEFEEEEEKEESLSEFISSLPAASFSSVRHRHGQQSFNARLFVALICVHDRFDDIILEMREHLLHIRQVGLGEQVNWP